MISNGGNKKVKTTLVRSKTHSGRKEKNKGRSKEKDNTVRGVEVTVTDSASSGQVVYGSMRIGGVATYIDTSAESAAYLITGDTGSNNQLVWTAKTTGASGNQITITLVSVGTNGSISISVSGNDITVTLKSSSGTPQNTMSEVIAAIRANSSANALVSIQKLDNSKNGVVAAMTQTSLSYGGGKWLYQYITLSCHELDSIETVYLDNKAVTFGATPDPRWGTGIWANKVFWAFQKGTDDQVSQPDLMAQKPLAWLDTDRQQGCAGGLLITVWDENLFAEGPPKISFQVKGKPVYDPRSGETAFTDSNGEVIGRNGALVFADFLSTPIIRGGYGIPYEKIHSQTLQDAADKCGESINSEGRYAIDGVYDTSESRDQIKEQMLNAMGATLVERGGMYYLYPGAWREPEITLTEDDVRDGSSIVIKTHVSMSDSFNCIRGTFVDPGSNYNEADIPPVKNSTYISEDNDVEIWEDMALNFVTQPGQAQRLLRLELERVRQGVTVQFPAGLSGFLLQAADTVNLELPEFGYEPKIFEVIEQDIGIENDLVVGVNLFLRETAEGIYSDGDETTVDVAPNTTLPDPTDADEPTDLTLESGTDQLYRRGDGTVAPRIKVSWTDSVSPYVEHGGHYEIQFKPSLTTNWIDCASVSPGTGFTYLTDVQDGADYDVRIRAVNSIEYSSDWVTESNYTCLGKTEKPSDVTGFAAIITDDGIKLTWDQITDLDKSKYEIRVGSSWAAGTVIARLDASDGVAYTYQYRTAGTFTLRIKAIDTSNNYSTNDSSISITLTGPNPIKTFTVKTVNNNVLLNWLTPDASTFSVQKYHVYKGDTFDTAIKIGIVFGTFHTYVERVGGTFTYWVVAEDVGGNLSSEISQSGTVTVSENFYINDDRDPLGDYTNYQRCVITGSTEAPDEPAGSVYLPVDTKVVGGWPMLTFEDQTVESWMDSNGWSTFQDAIDAGFNQFLQPGSPGLPGFLEMEIDYGVAFSNSFIDFTFRETQLGTDSTTITCTLYTSLDEITWTTFENAQQAFSDSLQYLKIRLDFTGDGTFSLSKLDNFRVVVSLQRDEETGVVSALASDTNANPDLDGTYQAFTKSFSDIEDIQLTLQGTDPGYVILNFDDSPNPEGFRVLAFDKDGDRVDYIVRYRARGAIRP